MYIKTYPSWWHFLLCISNSTSGSSTALPTATVTSEVNLFQHGLPFGCSLSRVCLLCHGLTHGHCLEVLQHDLMHRHWCFKVHLLQCGFIHSHQCLMCMLPSPAWAYSWPTIPAEVCLQWHRHTPRCFEMYQLSCGLIQMLWGVLLLHGLVHSSWSCGLDFTVEFQPVQYRTTGMQWCPGPLPSQACGHGCYQNVPRRSRVRWWLAEQCYKQWNQKAATTKH